MNLMAHFVQQATTNPIRSMPEAATTHKSCGTCKVKKPIEEFSTSSGRAKYECKKCAAKRLKEWRKK